MVAGLEAKFEAKSATIDAKLETILRSLEAKSKGTNRDPDAPAEEKE